MEVKCQCGSVAFKTTATEPLRTFHCHCPNCRKQFASAFGTSAIEPFESIFPLAESINDRVSIWERQSEESSDAKVQAFFCKTCGVRILHRTQFADGTFKPMVALKSGCVEGLDWSEAVHIFCRSAVVPTPEGVERWAGLPET